MGKNDTLDKILENVYNKIIKRLEKVYILMEMQNDKF
jgi:hypothetical protein